VFDSKVRTRIAHVNPSYEHGSEPLALFLFTLAFHL
jgi:hypothetical protein